MAEFLSDEWIAALDNRCRAMWPEIDPGADRLVIEPVVRGVPGRGEVRYRISFDAVACSVSAAVAGVEPDVRLETDYVTAAALAQGVTNAQAALAGGLLRVSGDVARLAAHASAISRLDDVFAAVRDATAYPGI